MVIRRMMVRREVERVRREVRDGREVVGWSRYSGKDMAVFDRREWEIDVVEERWWLEDI